MYYFNIYFKMEFIPVMHGKAPFSVFITPVSRYFFEEKKIFRNFWWYKSYL